MIYEDRVEVNPVILLGKPVIKGTRIPIYVILNLLGEGRTIEQIIVEYPDLVREDILASLRFAAQFAQFEELEEAVH